MSFSAPRARATLWLTDPGLAVSDDIRMSLLRTLFGTLPIFAGGVLNTVAVAALVSSRHPGTMFKLWLWVEIILCAVRLVVLVHSLKAAKVGAKTATDLYLWLAVLWAASIGYGCFITIGSGDWVSSTLACLSAAAMVGGICFRNFGAPRLVAVMIGLSLGPCAVASLISGQFILLVVAAQIPFYLIAMTKASYRLNQILITTMQAERDNDRRARHDGLTGLTNRLGLGRHSTSSASRGVRSGCCISTWTGSRRSTTRWAMPPGTSCWWRSRTGSAWQRTATRCFRGSAGTSSSCWCLRATPRRPISPRA
jgi:hypothetical protein